jgi:hypothetical protein
MAGKKDTKSWLSHMVHQNVGNECPAWNIYLVWLCFFENFGWYGLLVDSVLSSLRTHELTV